MKISEKYLEYRITFSKDKATGLIVAKVPTLGIADDGKGREEALGNIKKMIAFHLECLFEEGQKIPIEKELGEGIYVRVKHPARAA